MGTRGSNDRCSRFFWAVAVAVVASQTAHAAVQCTADDKCHFGSCAKKDFAYGNVTHNVTTIDCAHPYVKAVLRFSDPIAANLPITEKLAKRCGSELRVRPCCETRRPKSELDTILITLVSTVAVFCTFVDFVEFTTPESVKQ